MDKSKAILVLLVVNILAVFYIGHTINTSIRSSENNSRTEINRLNQQMQMLESQIANSIRRELTAQTDKIERLDYTWNETDLAQKKANIGLQVALKEVSAAAVIGVTIRRDGQAQPLEAELQQQAGMQYGAELELSLEHNYEVTVWERSNAGEKQLNATTQRLPLFDDMYRKRIEKASVGTSISNESLGADFSFLLKDMEVPGTELEKALLRIRKGGEVYDEIDMTEHAKPNTGRYIEFEDKYRVARASGQIDNSVTLEQFARDNGFDPDRYVQTDRAGEPSPYKQYELHYTIRFDEQYPELKLDRANAEQLSFQWVLRFKDGYEHVN